MDCQQAQEHIVDQHLPAAHLADCANCRDFAAAQQRVHEALSAVIATPQLSPNFRVALARKIEQQPRDAWHSFLPDVAHFFGCICTTLLLAGALPLPPLQVITAGLAVTLIAHIAQEHLQSFLEG